MPGHAGCARPHATPYDEMFASLLNNPDFQRALTNRPGDATIAKEEARRLIREEIFWAKRVLKKKDRVVWWLRWYRLGIYGAYLPDLLSRELAKLRGAEEKFIHRVILSRHGNRATWQAMHRQAEHYFGAPIPRIQAWHPAGEPIVQALNGTLHNIEQEWQENRKRIVEPEEDDTILIRFPDGWAWWLLDRSYCLEEARAMGHYGNGGSSESSERILSLREPKRGRSWEPHLTFILDSGGNLGEMKGRNNDKPVPRYHRYILELLQHDRVKGIKGGGYLRDHNFSMDDLAADQREKLYAAKPTLMSLDAYYRKYGPDTTFVDKVISTYKAEEGETLIWDGRNKRFIVTVFSDLAELIDDEGNDVARWAISIFDGNDHLEVNYHLSREESASNMLEELPDDTVDKIGHLLVHQHEKCLADWLEEEGYESDEEFDTTSAKSIISLAEFAKDDELLDALNCAYDTGTECGTEAEMMKYFKDAVDDSRYLPAAPDNWWDGKWHEALLPEEILSIRAGGDTLDQYKEYRGYDHKITMKEPYYGFHDFDKKAARERFDEEYDVNQRFFAAFGAEGVARFDQERAWKALHVDERYRLRDEIAEAFAHASPELRQELREAERAFQKGEYTPFVRLVRNAIPDAFAFGSGRVAM